MRSLRTPGVRHALPALLITAAALGGCAASGAAPDLKGSLSSSGSAGTSGTATGGVGPVIMLPDGTTSDTLLAARIRRLTVAEYEASLRDVVGDVAKGVTAGFTPDALQGGFTVNAAQVVDPVLIKQLSGAADTMAANVKMRVTELAPCADSNAQGEACAKTFIQNFASRAYRRPVEADEITHLLTVYHVAADSTGYADGIEHVTRAIVQSASFLYQTEIGVGTNPSVVKLTPYELAHTLSYLVTEKPASASLVADAVAGKLDSPEGRAAAAAQLATTPEGFARLSRVVNEWLGTAHIGDIAKDTNVYKSFADIKPEFVAESADFLGFLLKNNQGTVKNLLGSTQTYGTQTLATFYGGTLMNPDASAKGVISVPNRVGVLNRGAFLSVFAHASEPAPVLRGVALMRRVLCTDPGDPTKLKITVPAPLVDPTKTIRARFEAHASNAACAGCHARIDAYGFAFEHYDGMGSSIDYEPDQKNQPDKTKPTDSTTKIAFGTQFDGDYADSNALATAIANAESVRTCFARQLYRATAGTSAPADSASEDRFVSYWQKDNAASGAGDIVGTLKDFVASPAFAIRRPQ